MNKNIIFILIVVILCVLAQISLLSGTDVFQYSRAEIDKGQWWRFITGNIVHLSWRHLAMNVLALVAILALYPNTLKVKSYFAMLLLSGVSVTLGIWIFSKEIYWYVGLSGALHGLLITLIIIDYVMSKSRISIALALVIIAKLVWEGLMGPVPGSAANAGGPIVIEAHFYGFVGGLLIALSMLMLRKTRR